MGKQMRAASDAMVRGCLERKERMLVEDVCKRLTHLLISIS